MKQLLLMLLPIAFFSCSNEPASSGPSQAKPAAAGGNSLEISGHWEGSFTNGMKETVISFDVSEDGKELKNLTFKGYWYCDGKLDQTALGPEKSFPISGNAADGIISEPEGGGATATRYELHAAFKGAVAEGSFRMNINALGCDTYKLNWKAARK